MNKRHPIQAWREWREHVQGYGLRWVCGHPPLAWGRVLAPLMGAVASAAVVLAGLLPGLREDIQAEQDKLLQVRSQRDAARARLLQAQSALDVVKIPVSAVQSVDTAPARGPWHWQQLALGAGLAVEQLKPVQAAGPRLAQVQLRLRGRYAQHGAFVAALSDPAWAVRLLRYQLQSGAGGMHGAELALELPNSAALPTAWTGARIRTHRISAHDPLGEPPTADPLATVPPQWRAEFLRPKDLLETLPLSAFALAGTLQQGGEWRALLQGERMLHTLRVGDRLGQDFGRVQRITEQGMWLREVLKDLQGQWAERERLWRVGERP